MRKVLITLIVILSLILAALVGFMWYEGTHVFVDGEAYPKYKESLDLREKEMTESHYLAVRASLPDCEIIWNVPFQGGFQSSDAQTLNITTLAEEDIRILKAYFPSLKQINVSDCQDYAALAQLALVLPDCDVNYQVALGAAAADPDAVELTLEPGRFDFDMLMENLVYLTNLETVHFPRAELTREQHAALEEAYPELKVTATVEILGQEYDEKTTTLDLSFLKSSDVEAVSEKLALLPALSEVQLMKAGSGSNLTLADVQKMNLAAPDVSFHYSFDFYGTSISTMDEEVILKNLVLEQDGFADQLRMVLDVMENCNRFVVESRGQYDQMWMKISSAELAAVREEYRDKTKLVWRV